MNEKKLLQRLQLLKQNPDMIKPLTNEELADLLLIVLGYIKETDAAVKQGVLKGDKGEDGYTPQPDKDYMSLRSQKQWIQEMFDRALIKVRREIQNGRDGRDGKDAVVTEEQIQRAAELAFQMIQLPDFDTLITQEPQAIRNALELLQDDERLDAKAIKGLNERLDEATRTAAMANATAAGGTNKNWVNDRISRIRLEELANVYVSATEPSNPQTGDFWFEI